jgi:four helix bundle protein
VKSYRELIVWQTSFALANACYRVTADFPKHQQFSLVFQIQRSAVSIPSNIAEGYNRQSRKEYIHFLSIAFGSVAELETQISIACEQGYIEPNMSNDLLKTTSDISKMLRALMAKLKSLPPKP